MDNLFSLRFFVAPVLSLLFIVLALPNVTVGAIVNSAAFSMELEVIVLFIFMSGFLVSAIASFFINIFGLDTITFSAHEREVLVKRYPFLVGTSTRLTRFRTEFAEWLVMEDSNSTYIRDQVQARWSMFVVYFTSFLALVCVVLPTVYALDLERTPLWWGAYTAFVGIFFYNAHYYYVSVNTFVKLMLERLGTAH